ncbi:hypothetical protein LSUE1_G002973 [Lachnellula suecica]|uniref:GEgh 16 protein n=1 Tax=Lachnellula suecica TaxID=602035 RepID=A0A8T9CIB1_9HELO|nr:hypothetical protein LSUE1_G002973 [Lachnellula suecica]
MPSIMRILALAPALMSLAHAQGVVLSAQGTSGSPASAPFQVQLDQADANVINSKEITANVVNECGRTLLAGNIDIGGNTEDQLVAKTVTSVTKGGNVLVTINPLDGNGAGPYTCDLDQTSNSLGTGQTNVTVKETDGANNGNITLSVTMPADLACSGASTGNICTMRCFNTAAAGPFGGCVALQQTDVTPAQNTPANLKTAQTLAGINAQVAQNQLDIAAERQANADSTTGTEAEQARNAADALLSIDSTALATAGAADVAATGAATAAAAAATGKATKAGKGAAAATGATAAKAGKAGKKGAASASTAALADATIVADSNKERRSPAKAKAGKKGAAKATTSASTVPLADATIVAVSNKERRAQAFSA